MKKLTHEEFLERSNAKHNHKFKYPEEYNGKEKSIRITCPKHGDFNQIANDHMRGKTCPDCALEERRLSLDEIKGLLNKVHDNEFNYNLLEYTPELTSGKIPIICKKHGIFNQNYKGHRQGGKCPTCNKIKKRRIGFEKVANKKYNFKFDYSKMDFVDYETPIEIGCPEHGWIWITPKEHLSGEGCNKCALDKSKQRWDSFLIDANQVHDRLYKYPDYFEIKSNAMTKIPIICKDHGVFPQTAGKHLKGQGCPICVHKISKPEILLQNFIKELGFEVKCNEKTLIKPYELDIFIPELNKAIEFNGLYYHYSEKYFKLGRHAMKSNMCKNQGIRLLHVREELWIRDQEKVKEWVVKFLNHKHDK